MGMQLFDVLSNNDPLVAIEEAMEMMHDGLCPVNFRDVVGMSCMHRAARNAYVPVVRRLLELHP